MGGTASGAHIEACGFWLPCDQASFIHHERHKALRESLDLTTFKRDKEADDLEDQVFHRLVMVLPDWGYTYAIPVKHVSNPFGDDPDAAVFVNRDFQGFRPGGPQSKRDLDRGPAAVHWQGLALLVNSSGFYLWLLRYTMVESTMHSTVVSDEVQQYLQRYVHDIVGGSYWSRYSGWSDDEPLASDAEQAETLEMYRETHRGILTFFQINTIFEGMFSSSLDFQVFFYDNASDDIDITRIKQRYSLGNFIDLIAGRVKRGDYLDGESSSAKHSPIQPPIQLAEPVRSAQVPAGTQDPSVERTEARESQGPNAAGDQPHRERKLSASDERKAAATQFLVELDELYPHPIHPSQPGKSPSHPEPTLKVEADHLCHNYLGAKGCGPLLLKFLQATASETLQGYKRRVERCRRALVSDILEVTQRQEGVLQVEVPFTPKPTRMEGGFRIQDERILGVTEAQLRGYVLLLSAKLPLVNNVRIYIDRIVRNNHWYYQEYRARGFAASELSATERQAQADRRSREVSAAISMWTTLYKALANDLNGLEKAIRQEREDRMVQEEEKIRVEQETLAEIERLQERNAGSLSPQTSLTLGLLSNAFALASVLIALISISQRSPNIPRLDLGHYRPTDLIGFLGAVLGLGLALLALYFLAHYAFLLVFRLAVRFLRVQWSGRFYYEMDIHMEAPLDDSQARDLLDDQYIPRSYSDPFIRKTIQAHQQAWVSKAGLKFWDSVFWPGFRKPLRNSYRVERQDANEAMHKVYIEVTTVFHRTRWYQLARPRVNLVLVYEILFHRPAQTPRFILKDLRVISMQTQVLPTETLAQIKRMIAVSFINPLLAASARPLEPEAHIDTRSKRNVLRDALMSLTRPEPVLPTTRTATPDSRPGPNGLSQTANSPVVASPDGGAPAATVAPASLWRWLTHRSEDAVRMLAFAGVVGFVVYVSRVVFDLIALTSAHGFGVLVSGGQLEGTLHMQQYTTFVQGYHWMLLLCPLAAALTLACVAALAAQCVTRLAVKFQDALTLTDAEASQQRQHTESARENPHQHDNAAAEEAQSQASPGPSAAASQAHGVSNPSAMEGQPLAPSASAGSGSNPSASDSQPEGSAPVVRLSLPLRSWRRAVVLGWVALSWSGWCAMVLLALLRWALRIALATFGIVLAIPIVGELLAWVGSGGGR